MRANSIAFLALLLVATSAVGADQQKIEKAWTFKATGDSGGIAFTENGSGSTLGVVCSQSNPCKVWLQTQNTCEVGATFPVLATSQSGAASHLLKCENVASGSEKPDYAFLFDDLNAMLNVILKDHMIGFALPLASGEFRVVRFSLEGSNETLALLSKTITPTAKAASLKDQTL
jgi:hypothetical protein